MSKIFVVGSINMDLVINADAMPSGGETVTGFGFMTNPGGKGANQAVAAAKNGCDVCMVGCVGNEFGNQLTDTLAGYGVNVSYVDKIDDVSSGIAVIVVADGDNRIILDAGANARVGATQIDAALANAQKGDYLITQLEISVDSVAYALRLAKQKGMITVLNPAPAKELPREIWQYVDYFVPNQTEAEFYTGVYPDDEEKARAASGKLRESGVKNVVITLGSLGAIAVTEREVLQVSAFKVKPVDTTAAGDTFVGAMTSRLAQGESLQNAVTYANKAASITVTRKGAQQSIPFGREITW